MQYITSGNQELKKKNFRLNKKWWQTPTEDNTTSKF